MVWCYAVAAHSSCRFCLLDLIVAPLEMMGLPEDLERFRDSCMTFCEVCFFSYEVLC